jgi:hypothetical protein
MAGWKGSSARWIVGKEAQYNGIDSSKGSLSKWIVVRQYSIMGRMADWKGSTT